MIEIVLKFSSIDEALVAMAKMVDPSAVKAQPAPTASAEREARKGRRDKGQKREPYGPRKETEAGAAVAQPGNAAGSDPAPAAASVGVSPAPTPPVTPAPAPAPTVQGAPITPQQAMETLFNKKGIEITRQVLSRFGAQRVRDLTPDQHADFVTKATAVADGREQP